VGDAGARADIGRDGRARRKVVQQVRHRRDLVDLAVGEPEVAVRELDCAAAPVVAIEALQLDARADEVVADLAADGVARIRRVAAIAQQPVQAALGADIEARIGRRAAGRENRLRVGRGHWQGEERDGAQQCIFHGQCFPSRS
jgi:hypothetical protein